MTLKTQNSKIPSTLAEVVSYYVLHNMCHESISFFDSFFDSFFINQGVLTTCTRTLLIATRPVTKNDLFSSKHFFYKIFND